VAYYIFPRSGLQVNSLAVVSDVLQPSLRPHSLKITAVCLLTEPQTYQKVYPQKELEKGVYYVGSVLPQRFPPTSKKNTCNQSAS
jgi:hypothetical protein